MICISNLLKPRTATPCHSAAAKFGQKFIKKTINRCTVLTGNGNSILRQRSKYDGIIIGQTPWDRPVHYYCMLAYRRTIPPWLRIMLFLVAWQYAIYPSHWYNLLCFFTFNRLKLNYITRWLLSSAGWKEKNDEMELGDFTICRLKLSDSSRIDVFSMHLSCY